jgi:hypothetical protein
MLPKPASSNEHTTEALTRRHKQQAHCKVSGAVVSRLFEVPGPSCEGTRGPLRPALPGASRMVGLPELTQIVSLYIVSNRSGSAAFQPRSVANQPLIFGNKLAAIRAGFDLAMPNKSLFSMQFQHAAIHGFVLEVLDVPALLPPW